MRPIIDVHLDLSYNALSFDRDQTLTIAELRAQEKLLGEYDRGLPTVSLPEMRRANIGVCLATLLARAKSPWAPTVAPERTGIDHGNQEIACAITRGQLAYYQLLEARGQLKMIRTAGDLEAAQQPWTDGTADENTPIGYILSMEGSDPIVTPDQAEEWFEAGLRTLTLAHYGWSAYAMGTGGDGPLTPAGRELVKRINELGIVLDLTHTADQSFLDALELYDRPVFCSHCNCRTLVPGDRQISDEQIRLVAQRGGVIGAVLDAWMVLPNYQKRRTDRNAVTLDMVADHMDHVCQVTGSTKHAGIGSDLDGGFDRKQTPYPLDTIYDLHHLETLLSAKGYSDADLDGFMYGNWLRFFRETLPA